MFFVIRSPKKFKVNVNSEGHVIFIKKIIVWLLLGLMPFLQ